MGCKMSKATDQVIEPVSAVDAPASTAPVSASAQAAPVSSTEPAAEEPTAVEQPAAEAVQEEAPAAPVAEEETSAAEDAAPVEPAAEAAVAEPVAEVEAAIEPAVEAEAPVEPEAVAPEPEVTPVEAAVEEEAVDNNKEEERTTEEVETEVEAHTDNQGENALQFAAAGVTVDDKGVAFYQFEGTNASDPALTVVLSKRYSEFKALYPELAKLMASESNVPASQTDKFETYPALPALPKGNAATYFRRSSGKLLHEREAQFVAILNAAARHPIAASSDKFQAFLA